MRPDIKAKLGKWELLSKRNGQTNEWQVLKTAVRNLVLVFGHNLELLWTRLILKYLYMMCVLLIQQNFRSVGEKWFGIRVIINCCRSTMFPLDTAQARECGPHARKLAVQGKTRIEKSLWYILQLCEKQFLDKVKANLKHFLVQLLYYLRHLIISSQWLIIIGKLDKNF
jgi:hypothetical protein